MAHSSTFRCVSFRLPLQTQLQVSITKTPSPKRPSHHSWLPTDAFAASQRSTLIPLVLVLLFLAGVAFVGYQIYLSVAKIQEQASKKMGSKNVVFTKDGLKVGVKHVETEKYVDATQSWVVKAWNLSGSAKEEEKKQKQK